VLSFLKESAITVLYMDIQVTHQGKKHTLQVKEGSSVRGVLKEMKVNPETVLVSRDEEIILETEKLNDKDSIELIRVISGG